MLQKDSALTQSEVESVLKTTARPIPPSSMQVYDISPTEGWKTVSWGSDATGAGLVQAGAALIAS